MSVDLGGGESLVRTTPGDSDQSGLVFTRQWAVRGSGAQMQVSGHARA